MRQTLKKTLNTDVELVPITLARLWQRYLR